MPYLLASLENRVDTAFQGCRPSQFSVGFTGRAKKDGSDKSLADLLRDIVKHLTNNEADKAKVKALHGPVTELAKNDGLLSVTSMNQLVHHPSFSVSPPDICILFGNVFPLLEEMNG